MALHLGGLAADGYGACDVGGAVEILGAGVDEQQVAVLDDGVRLLLGFVVYDGAVRAEAGYGAEAFAVELVLGGAFFVEDAHHVELG